jgi:transcriptional regulator with XRE-family HTH domain
VTETRQLLVRNIKRCRSQKGYSQAELAERAGISAGYVGEVEMGRKFPSDEKLEAIALALGERPFRLLMGPEDLAEAMGPDAVYETAERLKTRLSAEIDEFVREAGPKKADPPPGAGDRGFGNKRGR